MRHSDLQKERSANHRIVCSGNCLCRDCKIQRKENKRGSNKAIRRINNRLSKERIDFIDDNDQGGTDTI